MNHNLSKIGAAENKEMLLSLYAQWQQSHPEIVAKYPVIDAAWGLRRIDRITMLIGKDVINYQVKYERDMLLMLILDEREFGPGAFNRAVEKLQANGN